MVSRITHDYFAAPGRPSYIVSIYNGAYNPALTPSRPFSMVQADSWSEAVIFGATYAKLTPGAWVRIETLASEGEHRNYVTAKMDIWTEKDGLVRTPVDLMPHESVKRLSEKMVNEPIAQEFEGEESDKMRRKLAEVQKAMKSAEPGQTLADVFAAQSEREINARARASQEALWKYGSHDPNQGSLFNPGGTLGGEVRNWLLAKIKVYSYHSAQELKELAHQDERFKGQLYSDLNPAIERGLEALRDEGILEFEPGFTPWYRPAKEEQLGLDAFETDSSGWDKPLGDNRGWFTFRSWVYRNKKPNADDTLLNASLQEAREQKDLMASEARRRVESLHEALLEETTTPSERPWSDIADVIDWDSMAEREALADQARSRLADIGKEIHEFRESGLISPDEVKELTNTRDIVQRLPNKQKEAFLARIAELEKQLEQKRAATPSPPTPQMSKGHLAPTAMNFTEEQANLLYDYFTTIVRRAQRKDPTPAEIGKVGEFIDRLQNVKPPIKFERAKTQIEDYARGLNALARGAENTPTATSAKRRASDLLNDMLERQLSPEEEDELMRLTGETESEGEGNLPLGLMEPERPRPTVRLIADSGPEKLPLGMPLRPDKPYPREITRHVMLEQAEADKTFYEKKGYVIHIEEF